MKKTIHSALFSLFTVLTTLTATSIYSVTANASEELLDKIAAVVNDHVILQSQLNEKMYEQTQQMAAQNIPVNNVDDLRKKVLDSMILEELQIERANQLGLKVPDDEINTRLKTIAEQNNMSLMQLRNRLNIEQANGFQKARETIKKQLLIQKLRDEEVISKALVTESEIQNYLKRQKLADKNVEVRLNHILIALPESATPEQRQQALDKITKIKQRIQDGEDFSQLAVRESNGGKSLQGGDLGWMKESEVPTFFA